MFQKLPNQEDSNEYFLKPLNPLLLKENKNREKSKNVIELVPFDNDEFNFISFVDFAYAVHETFIVIDIKQTKKETTTIELMRKKRQSFVQSIFYDFRIEIADKFKSFCVFIKNNMTNFDYKFKVGIECIRLQWRKRFNPFFKAIEIGQLQKSSLIYEAAIFFSKNAELCPHCILIFFMKIANTKTDLFDKCINNQNSIEDILFYCPGFIQINCSKNDINDIRTISKIFPWTFPLINLFHFIELDGSFRAVKPYTFCVAQGIIFNESFPIAITITPSESTELYSMIFDRINEITQNKINWSGKLILSDMGTALKSVCDHYNFMQFFCHRHIIEHFGSNSVLGNLCRKILKAFDPIEYGQICIEIKEILECYKKERQTQNATNQDTENKIKDLEIMISGDNGDVKSNYFYLKWALWVRGSYHVGRCTNHNESFHSVINGTLNYTKSFKKKLSNLIQQTLKHCSNLKKRKGTSIKRKVKAIIQFVINKTKNVSFNIMCLCDENCHCNEGEYNKQIYGAEIPCTHQILLPAKAEIEMIIKKLTNNKDGITINCLVYSILNYYKFFKRIYDENYQKLADDIIKNTNFNFSIQFNQNDFIQIIAAILKCFRFDFPEVPVIDQIYDHAHEIKYTYFDPSERHPEEQSNNHEQYFIKDDESDYFQHFQVGYENKGKEILFETINEVLNVYPEIIPQNSAYELCIDEFLKYMVEKNDDIAKSIAKFKIACWKKADKLMHLNRFFT